MIHLSPICMLHGLNTLDRITLSQYLAAFEDVGILKSLSQKFSDYSLNISNFVKEEKDNAMNMSQVDILHNVEIVSRKINRCGASDETLRIALLEHLLDAFDLSDEAMLTPGDAERICQDIGHYIISSVTEQHATKTFIKRTRDKIRKNQKDTLSFNESIFYILNRLLQETFEKNPEAKKAIINHIKPELLKLDSHTLKQIGLQRVTDKAIRNLFISGGGLAALMGTVNLSGFSAYIFAAKASAIIPVIGGKTLVSLLAITSSPYFFITVALITGRHAIVSTDKKAKKLLAMHIVALLTVQGGSVQHSNPPDYDRLILKYSMLLKNAVEHGRLKSGLKSNKYDGISKQISQISFPEEYKPSPAFSTFLKAFTNHEETKDSGFIYNIKPDKGDITDAITLGSITFADFIYELSMIDIRVIEAADFVYNSDMPSAFDFALFAEKISELSAASLTGHHSQIMGYTAERIVASQLIQEGYIVDIPASATQPGFDLCVDGTPFQVKCIAPENIDILEEHFRKYPETPVFVNDEVAEAIARISPEWQELVFYVNGFTHKSTDTLVRDAIDAGQSLDDYDFISSIAMVSLARHAYAWGKGEQSFKAATVNIAVDSVTQGGLAIAGGYVGSTVGMLVFGPAGAYILGGVFGVAAASKKSAAIDKIAERLDSSKDSELKQAADALLNTCDAHLNKKANLLDRKILSLPESDISDIVRYKLKWHKTSIHIAMNKNKSLLSDKKISGAEKVKQACILAAGSGIHPHMLQKNYRYIRTALSVKTEIISELRETAYNATKKPIASIYALHAKFKKNSNDS